MSLRVDTVTDVGLASAIADVAAATFPLACPPHSSPGDIAGFIETNLASSNFVGYIESLDSDVLVARRLPPGTDNPSTDTVADTEIIGYCLVHHTAPAEPDVAAVVTDRPVSEVSKMYVLPHHHAYSRGETGPSPSAALMAAAVGLARTRGSILAWLGVNQENLRAQRFYEKMGFERAGVKTFSLNGSVEHDFIYTRRL